MGYITRLNSGAFTHEPIACGFPCLIARKCRKHSTAKSSRLWRLSVWMRDNVRGVYAEPPGCAATQATLPTAAPAASS